MKKIITAIFGYTFYKNKRSLRVEIESFGKQHFPVSFSGLWPTFVSRLTRRISSKGSWPYIIIGIFLFLVVGQVFQPDFLRVINLTDKTAKDLIDQRIGNLAAIFSITMVVIGWLISQVSIKESVSYQLLFTETFLYPIFYFILTLIGFLMLCSLLREEQWFDLGASVISAMYLIIFALAAVAILFTRLIKAIGTAFFFQSLEKQVMKEMNRIAKPVIVTKKSQSLYLDHCRKMGFDSGIKFGMDFSTYQTVKVNIGEEPVLTKDEKENLFFAFAGRQTHRIRDVKMGILQNEIDKLELKDTNYCKQLGIGTVISLNYSPFYFSANTAAVKKIEKSIKAVYSFEGNKQAKIVSTPYLEELQRRFERDVAEGKKEQVQMALDIFHKIFQLENQIHKNC
ncbi:MAG: hypothetical protein Q8K92_00060 [Leadbetterella sp.]|nr:hypothetical protein [Leadbetterella sp.]